MKRYILIALLITVVTLSSCASPKVVSQYDSNTIPMPTTQGIRESSEDFSLDLVTPGSLGILGTNEVFNYSAGRIVDEGTPGNKPYYVVNRVPFITEEKGVTTEPSEVLAAIPIHRELFDLDTIKVFSSLAGDNLMVKKYDPATKMLIIDGFVPDTSRVLTIKYAPVLEFDVYLSNGWKPIEGYEVAPPEYTAWVGLSITHVTLSPESYAEVWVTLSVPEDTEGLPEKWEFWVMCVLSEEYNAGVITTHTDGTSYVTANASDSAPSVKATYEAGVAYRVNMK